MAERNDNSVESIMNFDLLDGTFTLQEPDINIELSQEDKEKLDAIFDNLQSATVKEITPKKTDFQGDAVSSKSRFLTASNEDLDVLESHEYEKSTHWQTTWSVRVFKGNYCETSVKFLAK